MRSRRPRARPGARRPTAAGPGSLEQGCQRRCGELRLRHEAARAAPLYEPGELRDVAAGGQHDRRGGSVPRRQPRRDLESVDAGQLHVEQHDLRVEPCGLLERGLAVLCLTDDIEPLRLEQRARRDAEAWMVVDDEDGGRHVRILALIGASCHTASRTLVHLPACGFHAGYSRPDANSRTQERTRASTETALTAPTIAALALCFRNERGGRMRGSSAAASTPNAREKRCVRRMAEASQRPRGAMSPICVNFTRGSGFGTCVVPKLEPERRPLSVRAVEPEGAAVGVHDLAAERET